MVSSQDSKGVSWPEWSQFSDSWRHGGVLAKLHASSEQNVSPKSNSTYNFVVARTDLKGVVPIPYPSHWLNHEPNLRSPYLPYFNRLRSPYSHGSVPTEQPLHRRTNHKRFEPPKRTDYRINSDVMALRIESLNRRAMKRTVQIYLDSLYCKYSY